MWFGIWCEFGIKIDMYITSGWYFLDIFVTLLCIKLVQEKGMCFGIWCEFAIKIDMYVTSVFSHCDDLSIMVKFGVWDKMLMYSRFFPRCSTLQWLFFTPKYSKNRFIRTITLQELPSPTDTIFVIFTPYTCSLVLKALGMSSPHHLQHAHMYSSSYFLLVPELWHFPVKLTTHHVNITDTPHTQHGNIQDRVFRDCDRAWSWSTHAKS